MLSSISQSNATLMASSKGSIALIFLATLFHLRVILASPISNEIVVLSSDQVTSFKPFTHYASAAYCPPSNISKWSCGEDCKANPTFEVVATGGDGSAVQYWYVGYDASLNSVIVGHQGTDPHHLRAIITDVEILPVPLRSTLFPDVPWHIKVHVGFKEEHAKTAEDILRAVDTTLMNHPEASVAVVGHSLGGALALLDSLYLSLHLPPTMNIIMIGYGMPRVGNDAFVQYIDQLVTVSHYHITNKKDIVPVIPNVLGYYHHCRGELHIREDDVWVSCPGHDNPSKQCSVGDVGIILNANVRDHSGPYDGIWMGADC
ncbi:alpha/beta-hydrolase [Marasmius fiardii PR-910]|nr:alpha/beta-hydrolase [Marasmius fiardii PR-910]